MKNKGFIGLGVMGSPMAGHISKAGYDVTVFNRTLEKSKFILQKSLIFFISRFFLCISIYEIS